MSFTPDLIENIGLNLTFTVFYVNVEVFRANAAGNTPLARQKGHKGRFKNAIQGKTFRLKKILVKIDPNKVILGQKASFSKTNSDIWPFLKPSLRKYS